MRANWSKFEPLKKFALITMGIVYQKWTRQMKFAEGIEALSN